MTGLKVRKSANKDQVHVCPGLASEEGDAVGMSCSLFGIAVRRCKCGRTG